MPDGTKPLPEPMLNTSLCVIVYWDYYTVVPYVQVTSLQLIWISRARSFHLPVPDLQMNHRDLTARHSIRDKNPGNGCGATCPGNYREISKVYCIVLFSLSEGYAFYSPLAFNIPWEPQKQHLFSGQSMANQTNIIRATSFQGKRKPSWTNGRISRI